MEQNSQMEILCEELKMPVAVSIYGDGCDKQIPPYALLAKVVMIDFDGKPQMP